MDAGLKPVTNASLGDKVWIDTNGNGQQDTGEAGLANVTVKLLNAAGTVIATTTTDANGNYLFNNLAAGQYAVAFTKPSGYTLTSVDVGNDALDSDANPSTGITGCYTLVSGSKVTTVDAGLKSTNTASLGDKVWLDANGNLLNAAGTVVGTQTTDGNGNYLFTDLAPGQYAVQFVKPNGLQFTTANVGNDGLDSDANITTGKTGLYTLTSGQQNLTVDAGKANKLVLDFTNQYVNYSLDFANKDSGTIENDACYDGEIYSQIKKITIITPVALDLNGDGQIGVTGATSSYQKDAGAALGHTVSFDIDADGKKDTIEWFNGSGDGILIDNRDGLAATDMDGSRLFGGSDGYGNGYYKMAALDANQDGKLSGVELKGIELWVDNGDAVVQMGEIQTLAQHGIDAISTKLNLTYDAQGKLHIESTATRTDGSTLMSEDVFFAQDNSAAALPTLQSVLNLGDDALTPLLGSDAGGAQLEFRAQESALSSIPSHSGDSEMLRKLIEAVSTGQHAQMAIA